MFKSLLAVAAVALSLAPVRAGAGFTAASTVIGVDVGNTGVLFIRFADATQCGSHIVVVPRTAAYYSEAVAMAMSALSTGKKLAVWIDACPAQGYPEAVRFANGYVW